MSTLVASLAPPRLREDLEIVAQERDGKVRFVIKDPISGRIYAFPQAALTVLRSIDGRSTLEDLARRVIGGQDPGPETLQAVAGLVAQADQAGLLIGRRRVDDRGAQDRDLVIGRSRRFNPLYIRLGSFDPMPLLRRLEWALQLPFSRWGLALFVSLVGAASWAVVHERVRYFAMFEVFTYFHWWVVVYALLAVATAVHEMGHVAACHRFGGRVREVGALIYMFRPAAFADISDTRLFSEVSKRVAVALGGVYVEGFLWCTSVAVWLLAAPYTRTSQVAFVLSVILPTRILFNLLPFLRLDGYWVLSDVFGVDNLRSKSFQYLLSKLPKVGRSFEARKRPSPREKGLMLGYGLSSCLFGGGMLTASVVALWRLTAAHLERGATLVSWLVLTAVLPIVAISVYRYLMGLQVVDAMTGPAWPTAAPKRRGLSVRGLEVELDGFKLGPIDFDVEPGKVTGFLGPNGAGKTTTLRLIMGMVRKDAGSAEIDGIDHRAEEKAFKGRVGFVPEESFVYASMRIREAVDFVSSFYSSWDAQRCQELLEQLELDPEKRVGVLSKGTRMKVNLLLALGHRPDVLILDEPTSSLDPATRIALLEHLQQLAHSDGTAVLLSSHNLGEVERVCDRLIVVHRGQIRADVEASEIEMRESKGDGSALEDFFLEVTR